MLKALQNSSSVKETGMGALYGANAMIPDSNVTNSIYIAFNIQIKNNI